MARAIRAARLTLPLLAVLAISPAFAGSPFVGQWRGPWHDENGQSGIFSLTIDDAGTVSGTVTNGATPGTVAGRITDAGDLEATYRYGVIPYRATVHLTQSQDHLRGTAHYALPLGVPFDSGPIDLKRQ